MKWFMVSWSRMSGLLKFFTEGSSLRSKQPKWSSSPERDTEGLVLRRWKVVKRERWAPADYSISSH
jgi:hypothetical protein